MARTTPPDPRGGTGDPVRDLQRALYRAAKADPTRRFHALSDKPARRDVLQRAWAMVRANAGAAGIDGVRIEDVERGGIDPWLDAIAADLRAHRYRPSPGRRAWIPKPGTTERRPLAIPTVRDRVVQAAVKLVIEPIFEADFRPASYGFRPGRSGFDGLQVVVDEVSAGRRWVVETDIASCFEAIPHDLLMSALERRISDRPLLSLLRALLRAGVLEDGAVRQRPTGTPQGGVISPLLANVLLHGLDVAWESGGPGVLVRYADDLVVLCRTEAEARAALARLRELLATLGLEPKESKTRLVHVVEGGEGFDLLGFHHRWVRARRRSVRHVTFLARWPSQESMRDARRRVRELTGRDRLAGPIDTVVERLNAFLRGWAGYFRYGHSTPWFDRLRHHTLQRLAILVADQHGWRRGRGWIHVIRRGWERLGLVAFPRTISPRPGRAWRG